jgi:hypothetical protein
MTRLLIISLLLILVVRVTGQELYCNVDVTSTQVQGTDRKVYETMRTSIYDFMNNRSWTNYEFKQYEKIECSILINVRERPATDEFRCEMTIAVRRPVFNSTYTTILFNFIDKDVEFNYIENQPLDFSTGMFTSNLTSILAYYAYIIIGLDFDSFQLDGGDPFFQAAQDVVNLAQNTDYKGWKSLQGNKNRYWLIENITNPSYSGVRQFYYQYHRQGLDVMFENQENGRKAIMESLKYLQAVKKSKPGLIILQIISDSKRDEWVNIFSDATIPEKNEAVTILKEIDPSNTVTYQKILQK